MRGGRTSASSSMGRREATGKRNGQRRRRAVEAAAGQTVGARLARGACSAVAQPSSMPPSPRLAAPVGSGHTLTPLSTQLNTDPKSYWKQGDPGGQEQTHHTSMESLLPPKSLMRTGQGPDTVQGSRFLLGPDRWLGPAAALRGPSSQPDALSHPSSSTRPGLTEGCGAPGAV